MLTGPVASRAVIVARRTVLLRTPPSSSSPPPPPRTGSAAGLACRDEKQTRGVPLTMRRLVASWPDVCFHRSARDYDALLPLEYDSHCHPTPDFYFVVPSTRLPPQDQLTSGGPSQCASYGQATCTACSFYLFSLAQVS